MPLMTSVYHMVDRDLLGCFRVEVFRACLVSVFENCFLLSKTRRARKTGRTRLVHSF